MATDRERAAELAQRRFRELVNELGKESGFAHGWKRQLADRVGMSPSHLTRVIAGDRNVSVDTMERAADEFDFSMSYYAAPSGSYHNFSRQFMLGNARRVPASHPVELVRLARKLVAAYAKGSIPDALIAELSTAVLSLPAVVHAEQLRRTTDPRERAHLAMLMALSVEHLFSGAPMVTGDS